MCDAVVPLFAEGHGVGSSVLLSEVYVLTMLLLQACITLLQRQTWIGVWYLSSVTAKMRSTIQSE